MLTWIEKVGMDWMGYDQIRLGKTRFDGNGLDFGEFKVIELCWIELGWM